MESFWFEWICPFVCFIFHTMRIAHMKSADGLRPAEILISILLMVWAFAIIYFYCEFGEMVTHQFNAFHEVLCQCNWYKFPLDVQRMLVIFMSDTQQPAFIRGYANIECTREAFKNVNKRKNIRLLFVNGREKISFSFSIVSFLFQTVHGGFSYFMALRQMDFWCKLFEICSGCDAKSQQL